MKLVARKKADQNDAAIDPWTVVHFGFGLAFGLMDIGFWKSMTVATGYEVFEQFFERSESGKNTFKTSGPEKWPNAVIDLGVFAAGHWLGGKWNET